MSLTCPGEVTLKRKPLHLEKVARTDQGFVLSDVDLERIIDITTIYFPRREVIGRAVRQHIKHADCIWLARRGGEIKGFSVASIERKQTPFYRKPLPVIYHHSLYLAPEELHARTGLRLGVSTYHDLLGWGWFIRRFVLVCRTLNPNVVKRVRLFSESYPALNQPVPEPIINFAESMLDQFSAKYLDKHFLLHGAFDDDEFKDVDFTDCWNNYLRSRCKECEKLVLSGALTEKDGRIICNGSSLLMMGYSKPFNMLKLPFK